MSDESGRLRMEDPELDYWDDWEELDRWTDRVSDGALVLLMVLVVVLAYKVWRKVFGA